jgi:Holliday junction resolvasome RuvABC DNA-binding subunit
MAGKRYPHRRGQEELREYIQMTPEEVRERDMQRLRAAQSRSLREAQRFLQRFSETPEQRRQREEAVRQARRRRALAKIGYKPEEFEKAAEEFELFKEHE